MENLNTGVAKGWYRGTGGGAHILADPAVGFAQKAAEKLGGVGSVIEENE